MESGFASGYNAREGTGMDSSNEQQLLHQQLFEDSDYWSNLEEWEDCLSLDLDLNIDEVFDTVDNSGLGQETSSPEEGLLKEMIRTEIEALDRGFDWEVSHGTDQKALMSPSKGLLEQTSSIGTEKETQPMPDPDPVLETSASPEVAGPTSLPEVESINTAGLPVFTPEDMATEVGTLTDPEIQDILSDLHGITVGIENLQFDELKATSRPSILSRLEDEVYKLPVERKVAYCQAVIKCPGLLSDERKMSFLGREDGDPALAAARLALYWELRLQIFGPERCFLPMTLNGAMRGEVENMLHFPVHQLLPVKDTAGRAVWYFDPSHRDFEKYSIEQEFMALWYLLDVASEDPNVFKHGIVVIGNLQQVEMKHYSQRGKDCFTILEQAMPMHFRGIHYCHPTITIYCVIPMLLHILGRKHRQRLRLHRGSEAQVLLNLEGFCLPSDRVPTELGGDVVLDMGKCLVDRMALENCRPDPRLVFDHTPIVIPQGPVTKRSRGDHSATDVNISKLKPGRKSDPRMLRAVDIRLLNPDLPLDQVLDMAGFRFDSRNENGAPVDADNVTVRQRKNNLCRRVRLEKARLEQEGVGAMEVEEDSSNTGITPNATFSAGD